MGCKPWARSSGWTVSGWAASPPDSPLRIQSGQNWDQGAIHRIALYVIRVVLDHQSEQ